MSGVLLSPRETGTRRERWSDTAGKAGLKGRGEEGEREGPCPGRPLPSSGAEETGLREMPAGERSRVWPVIPLTVTRACGAPRGWRVGPELRTADGRQGMAAVY